MPSLAMPTVEDITLQFLGTSAGKPSVSRNVSSLAVKLDGTTWLFDAGEGTQRQLMNPKSSVKMGTIRRVFVTHLHGDHVLGLVPLMCTLADGGSKLFGDEPATLEIYGPRGLRALIRQTLTWTYVTLDRPYAVHELLFPGESASADGQGGRLDNELEGRDLRQDEQGEWQGFVSCEETGVGVSAAPILHRVPCLGYLLTESPRPLTLDPSLYSPALLANAPALKAQGIKAPMSLLSKLQKQETVELPDGTVLKPPGMTGPEKARRLVILGDTSDATAALKLLPNGQGADLVVHESTNAFLGPDLDPSQATATAEEVTERAQSHGHSTPEIAASFAIRAGASTLILNHLSTRYADPSASGEGAKEEDAAREEGIKELARKEVERLGGKAEVRVARDWMEVKVPRKR